MKIRPVGAELLHADGRTDVTKQVVAVRNFAWSDNAKSALAKTHYFSQEDVFAAPTNIAGVAITAIGGT